MYNNRILLEQTKRYCTRKMNINEYFPMGLKIAALGDRLLRISKSDATPRERDISET
jgi:hypothetical protein